MGYSWEWGIVNWEWEKPEAFGVKLICCTRGVAGFQPSA